MIKSVKRIVFRSKKKKTVIDRGWIEVLCDHSEEFALVTDPPQVHVSIFDETLPDLSWLTQVKQYSIEVVGAEGTSVKFEGVEWLRTESIFDSHQGRGLDTTGVYRNSTTRIK